MNEKDDFIKSLTNYYKFLYGRFNKEADYIDKNNCAEDSIGYKTYISVIDELHNVEGLINYYKNV